jgi:outer membrane protein W
MRARGRRSSRGVAFRRLTAATAGLVACLVAGVAPAQSGKGDYIGRWSVAGDIGVAIPNTDSYDDVLTWRAGVGYSPLPQLEIDLELGRFAPAVKQPEAHGVPTHDIASGQIEAWPVCVTMRYLVPLQAKMATFSLLAGAGYYFINYTMADAPREVFTAGGVPGLPDQDVQDAWGFHAGAGLEYALTGWLSLTAEGRYVFLAPEVSGTAGDGRQLGGSLDLNTWLFTGGIKVAF